MYKFLNIFFTIPFLVQCMESNNRQEDLLALYAVELNHLNRQILSSGKQQQWLEWKDAYEKEKKSNLDVSLKDQCARMRNFIEQNEKNKNCIIL